MVATATSTAYQLFIGGEWSEAASGRTFEVLNPAKPVGLVHFPLHVEITTSTGAEAAF